MQQPAPTASIESRTAAILDGVPDPLVVLAPLWSGDGELLDLPIADANPSACVAFGRTRETLVGTSLLDVAPLTDHGLTLARARDLLRSGRPLALSEVGLWTDPSDARRYDVHVTPVGDLVLVTWRDITAAVKLRDALAESERRYRMIAEHVTDFVIEAGPDGVIRWASPSITHATGWSIDEVVGRPAAAFVPPGQEARAASVLAGTLEGRVVDGRVDLVMRDGSTRWFQRTVRPARDDTGAIVAVIISFRDVQAEVDAERALQEREQQYRLVLENARDVIYLATPDARVAWVSPSITELLGWRPEEIVGTPTIDLVHPDDIAGVLRARAAAAGGQASVETRFRRADGGWRWMSALGRPVVDATGTVIGRTGSLRDSQAEHEAREALEASEARFRLLAENAADVVLHGLEDGIAWVSPSARETLGWEPSDLIGRRAEELVHPADRATIDAGMEALASGRTVEATFRFLLPDGGYRWVSAVARPVLDDARGFVGLTASIRDVTALREARERIEAFNATLEQRVRERTEELEAFTRALSHDLRSPLRWIDGFAAMLERDADHRLDETGHHELAAIRQAAQRMGMLADALLEWVRLGNQTARPEPIDWGRMVAEVRRGLAGRGLDPGAFDEGSPLVPVTADRSLLRVTLVELLDNAQRHASPGGRPRITLAAGRTGERVRVSVADDGIGIPAGQEAAILEPFVRLRDEDVPGVGIGLAIARRAVRMLGSDLCVSTAPGATFSFELPPA